MRDFDYKKISQATWDSETLALVAQIHEFKGRQALFLEKSPAEFDKLVEIAKIQSTEASNKIEGIITTNTRIKQLCMEKTTPRNRDEKEIIGYRDVLNTIHESYEYIHISSSVILQLHKNLYNYSGKGIGGQFKNTQNYIAEERTEGKMFVRFLPLEPFETPIAVESLCENYNRVLNLCEIDPLILIPNFILDFLCIHPFNDGNGRMSRLLTTLLLYKSGYMVGRYVSLESKIEHTKATYYDVLYESSKLWREGRHDAMPFVKYLLRLILASYREFEDRVDMVGEKNTAITIVKKAVMQKLGKFTKTEIMEMCPTIGKTSTENALKILVAEGTLEIHGKGRATFYTIK